MNFSYVIEAMKTLYASGKVSKESIEEKLKKKMISQEEFNYIVGEEDK